MLALFTFYALPSGGKSKDKVVHSKNAQLRKTWILGKQRSSFWIQSFEWFKPISSLTSFSEQIV